MCIVLGVVIFVVVVRAKKRKRQLQINNIQNVMKGKGFEMKQEVTIEKKAGSKEYLNQNSSFIGMYSDVTTNCC